MCVSVLKAPIDPIHHAKTFTTDEMTYGHNTKNGSGCR